jgi:acyl carrier protein
MSLPESVTSYISENAKREGVPAPQPSDDLFKSGVLDSFTLVDLVAILEEQFSIKIPDGDVSAVNFQTIQDIENYVDARRG